MAWELAIAMFILSLILDLIETFFNIGQIRSIIFSPLSFFKGLKS